MAILIRDATPADIPALTEVRAPDALHRGRLRDAKRGGFRYCVIEADGQVIGFVSLVFARPASWVNHADQTCFPEINDLYLAESRRGQGGGSAAIRALEQMAAEAGCNQIYIAVEPVDNPRALALYQRMGYRPIQSLSEPYFHRWACTMGTSGWIRASCG